MRYFRSALDVSYMKIILIWVSTHNLLTLVPTAQGRLRALLGVDEEDKPMRRISVSDTVLVGSGEIRPAGFRRLVNGSCSVPAFMVCLQ